MPSRRPPELGNSRVSSQPTIVSRTSDSARARPGARASARGGPMRIVRTSAAASRIALASVSAAVLMAGCHVPATGGSGAAGAASGAITRGGGPRVDYSPLALAVQGGLFRQHRLDVTPQTFKTLDPGIEGPRGGSAHLPGGRSPPL